MSKAIIIRTNGRVEDFTVQDYRDIQAAVGGTFCSVISSGGEKTPPFTLYGNDEAKICSYGETIGMPLNISAMLFVAHCMGKELNELCTLHGDFLIVGDESEEDGDMQDIHDEVAEAAQHFNMWQDPKMTMTSFATREDLMAHVEGETDAN